ncbi:MAG: response regulator transcription factor [Pirellulales bacterium]|nr:response regulator transcription factor [Pirellulales bacterium]
MGRFDPALYVIDDDVARDIILAVAAWLGIECQMFSSAERFLGALDSLRPGCILADLGMGGRSGLDLLASLSRRGCRFPVVLTSADADVAMVVQAMQQGAMTVLAKSCSREELEKAIGSGIERAAGVQADRQKRTAVVRRFDALDERERRVMHLMVRGEPNKLIARRLDVSTRTVDRVRAAVYRKIGVESAVELARLAANLDTLAEPPTA